MSTRIQAITMPKWGMTMTEGKVAGWLIEEGQQVTPGLEVIEIETTKITNVMETPAAGIFRRKVVVEGATAPVGALLGVVTDGGVPDSEIDSFVDDYKSKAAAENGANAGPVPRLVAAGATQLNVLTLGEGPGLPAVLIHGFGGDLNSWLFNQAAIADGRAVHAVDLPSHGGSPMTDMTGGVPALARAILAALDTLGATRVHLVGHSLGGAIAIWMAKSEPARVASLTLLAPGGIGPEINTDFLEGFARADKRKDMKDALGLLFADAGAVSRDMVENALKYKRLDGAADALSTLLGAMLKDGQQRGGLREALAASSVPSQIIWGTADRIIHATQADALPASVSVHRLAGIGHMPQMEAAAEVNRLILDQLKRVEA